MTCAFNRLTALEIAWVLWSLATSLATSRPCGINYSLHAGGTLSGVVDA